MLSPLRKVLPALRIRTTSRTPSSTAMQQHNNNDESNIIVEVNNKLFQFRLPRLQPPTFSQKSFYFGAPADLLFPPKSAVPNKNLVAATTKKTKSRPVALSQVMTETLDELRGVREEMEALRRELRALKQRMTGVDGLEDDEERKAKQEDGEKILLARRKQRQREYDRLARDIEKWAEQALFHEDGEQDGWKEVQCNKLIQHAFNRNGNVRAYVKVRTTQKAFLCYEMIHAHPIFLGHFVVDEGFAR